MQHFLNKNIIRLASTYLNGIKAQLSKPLRLFMRLICRFWLGVVVVSSLMLVALPSSAAVPEAASPTQNSTAEKMEGGQSAATQVNINTASAEELAMALVGVGAAKAIAIVTYRDTFGAFKTIDELQEVKGIGQATVDKNRASINLN